MRWRRRSPENIEWRTREGHALKTKFDVMRCRLEVQREGDDAARPVSIPAFNVRSVLNTAHRDLGLPALIARCAVLPTDRRGALALHGPFMRPTIRSALLSLVKTLMRFVLHQYDLGMLFAQLHRGPATTLTRP
jgi:hypothetical protein